MQEPWCRFNPQGTQTFLQMARLQLSRLQSNRRTSESHGRPSRPSPPARSRGVHEGGSTHTTTHPPPVSFWWPIYKDAPCWWNFTHNNGRKPAHEYDSRGRSLLEPAGPSHSTCSRWVYGCTLSLISLIIKPRVSLWTEFPSICVRNAKE